MDKRTTAERAAAEAARHINAETEWAAAAVVAEARAVEMAAWRARVCAEEEARAARAAAEVRRSSLWRGWREA